MDKSGTRSAINKSRVESAVKCGCPRPESNTSGEVCWTPRGSVRCRKGALSHRANEPWKCATAHLQNSDTRTATPRQRRPQSIHQGTARIPSACTCILPFICAVHCLSAHCPHHVAYHHLPSTALPTFAAAVCLGRISSLHATATTHEDLIHHSHLESIQVDNLTTFNFSPPILIFFSHF